jgi:hypothetical protein
MHRFAGRGPSSDRRPGAALSLHSWRRPARENDRGTGLPRDNGARSPTGQRHPIPPGSDHCYMVTVLHRFKRRFVCHPDRRAVRRSPPSRNGSVAVHPLGLAEGLFKPARRQARSLCRKRMAVHKKPPRREPRGFLVLDRRTGGTLLSAVAAWPVRDRRWRRARLVGAVAPRLDRPAGMAGDGALPPPWIGQCVFGDPLVSGTAPSAGATGVVRIEPAPENSWRA